MTQGAPRDDRATAEKLNEFFVSVFTTENTGEIPVSDQFCLVDKSGELDYIHVTTEEVLEQIDKH